MVILMVVGIDNWNAAFVMPLLPKLWGPFFIVKKAKPCTIWRVLTALAEGVPIQSVARIFSLPADSVLNWLKEAARANGCRLELFTS
jgi:hypothetical protein